MIITRLYTDENEDSVFEDLEIELSDYGDIGFLSQGYRAGEIFFRETAGDYNYDFHNAPQRQFIVFLNGETKIETSRGDKRVFRGGEILLAEDITGKGHKSRSIDGKLRSSVFITLGENDAAIK